jgi:RNA polymerase sigma-70 factor (ECF subfamily)
MDNRLQTLVDAAKNGSPTALGELVDRYRKYLLLTANRTLPATVQSKVAPSDIVQDTSVDMVREFAQFRGATVREFVAWMKQILRNNIADVCRGFHDSQKRDVACESPLQCGSTNSGGDVPVSREQSPSVCAAAHEAAEQIATAMRRLHPRHRDVLRMRSIQGLSFQLVAQHIGCSADAARKLWASAVEKLQTELELLNEYR